MGTARAVRTLIVTGALLAAWAVPAFASTGVTVGPGRQILTSGQGTAEVYVTNAGDHPTTYHAYPYEHTAQGWARSSSIGLFFSPHRFTLQPREQATITVRSVGQEAPCALQGIAVQAEAEATSGIASHATAIGQLAVLGPQGKEADCVPLLPKPPAPAPVASSGFPAPWIAGGGIIVLLIVAEEAIRRMRGPTKGPRDDYRGKHRSRRNALGF
jgi:hypothetical protein